VSQVVDGTLERITTFAEIWVSVNKNGNKTSDLKIRIRFSCFTNGSISPSTEQEIKHWVSRRKISKFKKSRSYIQLIWSLNNYSDYIYICIYINIYMYVCVYIYIYIYVFFFLLWRCDPTGVMDSSFLRFLNHTQRRTTVGRTPPDEWSARRRDLYVTTHDTHNRQISMPPLGFEPTISAGERSQTYVLDRAATGTSTQILL